MKPNPKDPFAEIIKDLAGYKDRTMGYGWIYVLDAISIVKEHIPKKPSKPVKLKRKDL